MSGLVALSLMQMVAKFPGVADGDFEQLECENLCSALAFDARRASRLEHLALEAQGLDFAKRR